MLTLSTLLVFSAIFPGSSLPSLDPATRTLAHDIFKQLVETNTTDSSGSVTRASEVLAERFRQAGFAGDDLQVLGPDERKKNLVVRLRGSGAHRAILMIGHLDVVEARREDWTTDPFEFVEKDGYFYGRGTQDMKDADAIMATTLMRLKQEGFRPDRDIIAAFTADEEGGRFNGVQWLLRNHRPLVEAEFVLNHDENSLMTDHGKPLAFSIDAGEKTYSDYRLEVTDAGGHSSLPRPRNPIYKLSGALVRLSQYKFPFELNQVTRAYYQRMAAVETGQRAQDIKLILADPADLAAAARLSSEPQDNALLHTTCVATRLSGGHANNALPQRAEAIVNCRILPGHSKQEVRDALVRVISDPEIRVDYVNNAGQASDTPPGEPVFRPLPLRGDVMSAVEKVVSELWPGTPVLPVMSQGASDGIFTTAAGLPTYCFSGVAVDRDDKREHGKDERVREQAFYQGLDFEYRFLKLLTSAR
jgi:acetylornithine deacetylase/succinyl-diaminopimelate desuccinylase-like protein